MRLHTFKLEVVGLTSRCRFNDRMAELCIIFTDYLYPKNVIKENLVVSKKQLLAGTVQ